MVPVAYTAPDWSTAVATIWALGSDASVRIEAVVRIGAIIRVANNRDTRTPGGESRCCRRIRDAAGKIILHSRICLPGWMATFGFRRTKRYRELMRRSVF